MWQASLMCWYVYASTNNRWRRHCDFRLSVRLSFVNICFTWWNISLLGGGISVKLATNIRHLSGHCYRGFQGQSWKVKVICVQICKCYNSGCIHFDCMASRLTCLLLFYCHYTSFVVAAVIKHPITKAFLQKFVSKRQAFAVIIADMLNVMLSMHTAMTMREFVWSFVARSVSTASASRNLVMYCRTLFFRCILISRLPYVENLLHFNFADFPVYLILLFYSNRENLMLAKYTFYSIGSQWRGKMEGETGLRTLAWKEVLKMVYYWFIELSTEQLL